MTWRPGAIALARAANALFFVAVSAYCLLAYSPFAYNQFIEPNVVPALTDFVAVSPWLFWAMLLTTILTFMPQLRGAPGRALAWSYVATGLVLGVVVIVRPPLASVGNTLTAFALGLAALVPPIWLASIDHAIWPAPRIGPVVLTRALTASVLAAAISWGAYAMAVPLRLAQATGLEWPAGAIVLGLGSSLILDLYVFIALFLAVATLSGVGKVVRPGGAGEYWLLVALLAVCSTLVLYLLVCSSIAFTGRDAWICSGALSVSFATVWAGIARLRSQPAAGVGGQQADIETESVDAIGLFGAPVAGVRSRVAAGGVLIALPFIAYTLVELVRQFDWNFLLQKLGVLIVWLVAFGAAHAIVRTPGGWLSPALLRALPVGVLVLYHLAAWAGAHVPIDRYVAVDPSFRLLRDARTAHSSETVDYYRHLRANTLLAPRQVQGADIDFTPALRPAAGSLPHIFLFVVDSMRRDYLSPYNPRVTFTPRIGELAAGGYVFERAFSRYSGTALAIPSIWAGGMVPHMLEPPAFLQRNTLRKLLDANDYRLLMGIDHIVKGLVPVDGNVIRLDEGKGTMDVDVCSTVDELARTVQNNRGRPMFFYSLPQNVHIAVATKRTVPEDESYPDGFYDRIASSVHRVDACLGRFIDFLQREDLYDNSIIILTADHGDSLGEEGRWGHAYFMYPEVMNVPLIVHLPSRLKARFRTDLGAVAFTSDITPSLYALLGYEPADLGPLFGRRLFARRNGNSSLRRPDPFLLASSYGAVYGVLRQNGRRLYVVDAVDGREYAFDLSASAQDVAVTPAMTAVNRRLIEEQLRALASVYRYRP